MSEFSIATICTNVLSSNSDAHKDDRNTWLHVFLYSVFLGQLERHLLICSVRTVVGDTGICQFWSFFRRTTGRLDGKNVGQPYPSRNRSAADAHGSKAPHVSHCRHCATHAQECRQRSKVHISSNYANDCPPATVAACDASNLLHLAPQFQDGKQELQPTFQNVVRSPVQQKAMKIQPGPIALAADCQALLVSSGTKFLPEMEKVACPHAEVHSSIVALAVHVVRIQERQHLESKIYAKHLLQL